MKKSNIKSPHLLIPYVTAGFPTKKLFAPILRVLSDSGADFIEIGVPHSDPLADGPVIQQSSKIALDNGVNLKWILKTCHSKSLQRIKIKPLILFSYLNPVLNYGFEKLLKELPKPLFHGLIIPDLPLEEAKKFLPFFKKHKLNLILLIAPTTKTKKLKEIAKLSSDFIYLVSVVGVTGIRKTLFPELRQRLTEIKHYTDKPVVVGFGISNPKQVKTIISYGASGVVIGSALIKLMSKSKSNEHLIYSLKRTIYSFKH